MNHKFKTQHAKEEWFHDTFISKISKFLQNWQNNFNTKIRNRELLN